MRCAFKIEKVWKSGKISIKFVPLNDVDSIDDYPTYTISSKELDLYDCESFVESLMKVYGNYNLNEQDKKQIVDNPPENITGELNLEDLVGRVIAAKTYNDKRFILKMKRIEL
jgi:hypothetical protein|tara:strand:- start:525 stop:863 length:339 start_codon:yes stop_codon:yes gene_type:complete